MRRMYAKPIPLNGCAPVDTHGAVLIAVRVPWRPTHTEPEPSLLCWRCAATQFEVVVVPSVKMIPTARRPAVEPPVSFHGMPDRTDTCQVSPVENVWATS